MNDDVGGLLVSALHAQRAADPTRVYDEVLREVSARSAAEQSLGKADIGALVLWKRITAQARWASRLMTMPDAEVRRMTGAAFACANDLDRSLPSAGQAARSALWNLPGMRGTGALASAVLVALAPDRMAVWDRRVAHSLEALSLRPRSGAGFYGRYLTTVLGLAAEMGAASEDGPFIPRDVDLALFAMAGSVTPFGQTHALR